MKAPDVLSLADKTIRDEAQQIGANMMFGREWIGNVALLLYALVASLILMFHIVPARHFECLAIIFVLIPILLIMVKTGIAWRHEAMTERKLTKLLRSDYRELRRDVSSGAIAPLLVVIGCQRNDDLFPTLMALLSDLLKAIQEEDALDLTKEQRQVLHKLVEPGKQDATVARSAHELGEAERRELRPSIVRALAWLGNASSIPVLERFSEFTDDPELRQSALQSVEQIRARLQYGPEEMLRASRAPERPDTLLRAALPDKPHDHDPQQLLRADNATSHPQGKSALSQTAERTMPD